MFITYSYIRENADELARLIEYTPWSRDEYNLSRSKSESEIENARRFLVKCWMSIGSTGSFSNNIAGNNGNIDCFVKVPELIKQASDRLRSICGNIVQIENRDAFELIEKYNRDNVLMYLDPPYVLSTRNKKYYSCEMTDEDHERLCELIKKSKAKIILSGYKNEIYDRLLPSTFEVYYLTAYDEQGNKRRETLWINYAISMELFNGG